MERIKPERKPPLSFVNRGGKHASGIAVGDEDPDHSPMDDRRTAPKAGQKIKPAEKTLGIRSSRL
ncbi:MAG TPA: hypothetical protein VNS34_04310 [Rhizobiaceae bacterium]|jgi:hypothetical protein|nr:hypothetical protein [Rhizobiaceae bacterium]